MNIANLLVQYPLVLIPILLLAAAIIVSIVEWLLAWQARRPGPVATAVADYLVVLATDALQQINVQLGNLEPDLRSQKIVEIARALYALIPPDLTLKVTGRSVVVPVRYLIPEDIFVQLVVALANGAADQVEAIRRQIQQRYQQYKQTPGPTQSTLRAATTNESPEPNPVEPADQS